MRVPDDDALREGERFLRPFGVTLIGPDGADRRLAELASSVIDAPFG